MYANNSLIFLNTTTNTLFSELHDYFEYTKNLNTLIKNFSEITTFVACKQINQMPMVE